MGKNPDIWNAHGERKCADCGEFKDPISEYPWKRKYRADGTFRLDVSSYCRRCTKKRETDRLWRKTRKNLGLPTEGTKVCVLCGTEKLVREFHVRTRMKLMNPWCSECGQDPKNLNLAFFLLPSEPEISLIVASNMWATCRASAAKRDLLFTIGPEDLLPLPLTCPITDVILDYRGRLNGCFGSQGKKAANWTHITASVDRIDPKRGYEPGNVHIISYKANTAKSDFEPKMYERLARFFAAPP